MPRNEDPVAQKDKPARETANLSPGETMPAVTAKAPPVATVPNLRVKRDPCL